MSTIPEFRQFPVRPASLVSPAHINHVPACSTPGPIPRTESPPGFRYYARSRPSKMVVKLSPRSGWNNLPGCSRWRQTYPAHGSGLCFDVPLFPSEPFGRYVIRGGEWRCSRDRNRAKQKEKVELASCKFINISVWSSLSITPGPLPQGLLCGRKPVGLATCDRNPMPLRRSTVRRYISGTASGTGQPCCPYRQVAPNLQPAGFASDRHPERLLHLFEKMRARVLTSPKIRISARD